MNRFEKLRSFISEKEGKILSARGLAGLLGVAHNTVTRVEKGDIPPSPKVAKALNEKYGISEEWYLTGKGYVPWEFDESAFYRERYEKTGKPGMVVIEATANLQKTPQRGLIDHYIEAGKNPIFREALYKVLEESGILPVYEELAALKKELAELRGIVAEPKTDTAGGHTFESTEVILKFPEKPSDLDQDESDRWDRNEQTLRRWGESYKSFYVPSWAVARFCREVVNFYSGGKLDDIGGLLRDFIEEGKQK